MYRVIIEFRDELSDERKMELKEAAAKAFNNRGGQLKDISQDINVCIFEGDNNMYGCIALANLTFDEVPGVKGFLKIWDWEDTEDVEFNHSVMESYIKYENGKR